MMPNPADDRSAQAIAFERAAQVMTISLEMVVPGLLGYWLDQRLGTKAVFLLCGFALGAVMAGLALAKIARRRAKLGAERENEDRSKVDGSKSAD